MTDRIYSKASALGDESHGPASDGQPPSSAWISFAAGILGAPASDIERNAAVKSFIRFGGTSLQAIELVAIAENRLRRVVDIRGLLGPEPLAEVMAMARPVRQAVQPYSDTGSELRDLTARQAAMMLAEETRGGTAFHLLFSANIVGRVDVERLRAALCYLTRRHEALRSVFLRESDGSLRRRVLRSWKPELIEQSLPARKDRDPVESVHALLEPASAVLLRPFERPLVVFVHSQVDADRSVLSVLTHQAVADCWSIGLLWRELAAAYDTGDDDAPGSSLEPLVASETAEPARLALAERLAALAGAPTVVELPSDLIRPLAGRRTGARVVFDLSDEARRGCDRVTAAAGLTRNTVLLAAWALVVARRAAVAELVMGVAAVNRPDIAAMRVIGPCVTVLPVRCTVAASGTVRGYLDGIGAAMRSAMAATAVPFEHLVARLDPIRGDSDRNPLVQVAFAARDELIPTRLGTADLTLTLHEGYCGGTEFDAVLHVRRWADGPQLALEYGAAILRADEAMAITRAIDCTLVELAANLGGPLDSVRTLTARERRWLIELGAAQAVSANTSVWHLIAACAGRVPGNLAIRDIRAGQELTYHQLIRAAEALSAEFAAAGVTAGDCIGVTIRRSAREIVTVLAIVRLGAAYLAIEPGLPSAAVRQMLNAAGSLIVVGDGTRLTDLRTALHDRKTIVVADPLPIQDNDAQAPPAAGADPSRVAYVAFTSGSTGTPKGTQVPHGAIVRLARNPTYLRPGSTERFLRLTPLGFDVSTMEIFAPLAAGGCIEVYPDPHVVPTDLAEFIRARQITGLWLTAGIFRLVADYCPDAFQGVRQLLTGGEVVPPEQVRKVLQMCPGLQITNGYGPTENTTFTTVHHVDDPAEVDDPLPIGKPIPGTGVMVLDGNGRLAPPGSIGELYVYGDGLAVGYVGLPRETAAGFGYFSPELSVRLYRTGDLVRWDAQGRLRFLGRRDGQVKIRGFRVELDGVARVLRDHQEIRDAVVVAIGPLTGDRRLLAGLVTQGNGRSLVEELRAFAAERLPGYSVPVLWALVGELPVTSNGKLDVRRLEELARQAPPPASAESADALAPAMPRAPDALEQLIASAWSEVLGAEGFGFDEGFFDVGGDSLQLLRVAARLQRALPKYEIPVQALAAHLTISALADYLRAQAGEGTDEPR